MDKRVALSRGAVLAFPGLPCTVERETGRGSNAIVYKGWYADALDAGARHDVLIKELFPYHEKGAIYRDERDDAISFTDEGRAAFETHTASFLWGNAVHLKLRERYPARTGGNLNTYRLNRTYYTLLDFTGGRTLLRALESQTEPQSLREIVRRVIGVLRALQIFHDMGCLHLDVSPDNIVLIDDGEYERVELIDYNSVVRPEDIASGREIVFSAKPGYAPPEVRLQALSDIGTWTDLYAVTAVLYRCLSGRALTRLQAGGVQPLSLDALPVIRGAPETVKSLLRQILNKGLHPVARKRYQTAEAMLADLSELIDRIDGVGVTHWALWETAARAVRAQIERNPSLKYITQPDALYPMNLSGGDMDGFLRGSGHALLLGAGGMGKTTLLLRTAYLESQVYRSRSPVALYVSLYGCREGDGSFIHDSLLRSLRFKPETGGYDDARHALDALFESTLPGKSGRLPFACLLLDGYNEIAGNTEALRSEIEALSRMPGVRVLIAARSELSEFTQAADPPFQPWRLCPLAQPEIKRILGARGLLLPESEPMRALLSNAMMLSLYARACLDSGTSITLATREELIDAYLNALVRKEADALSEHAPERWQIEAAARLALPMIAGLEARRARGLSAAELLSLLEDLYRLTRRRALIRLFPGWTGHMADIRGGAKDGDAWFGLIVRATLWRRLGLLTQDDRGAYRVSHQEVRDALAPREKPIRALLKRRARGHAAAVAIPCVSALAVALWLCLGGARPAPPYEPKQIIRALECAQQLYTDMNTQHAAMASLLDNPTPDTVTTLGSAIYGSFRTTRGRLEADGLGILPMMDKDEDGSVTEEAEALLEKLDASGKRVPWGDLPFDKARFLSMDAMLFERGARYLEYIDRLERVYASRSASEYAEYAQLMRAVLDADARVCAACAHIVFTMRTKGIVDWEQGSGHEGLYDRFTQGRHYYTDLLAYEDKAWQEAGIEAMITNLDDIESAAMDAQKKLNASTIYNPYITP